MSRSRQHDVLKPLTPVRPGIITAATVRQIVGIVALAAAPHVDAQPAVPTPSRPSSREPLRISLQTVLTRRSFWVGTCSQSSESQATVPEKRGSDSVSARRAFLSDRWIRR